MYTALVVEDNVIQLAAIEKILKTNYSDMRILKAADYFSAAEFIQKESIQLFLLDIQLDIYSDQDDGIVLGKYIRTMPEHSYTPILYITSIPDKIAEAVNDIHCYNYLLKPYSAEELVDSVRRLLDSPMVHNEPLKFRDLQGIYFRIDLKKLVHIHSEKKVLVLHTTTSDFHTRDMSLEQLLTKLPDNFLQCHKSHIVNLDFCKNYDKTLRVINLDIQGNSFIPVGKVYKEKIEKEMK